ncbi:MAG TPA: hypothetical protein VNJ08_14895 [Bacteriovoracaceae bacterium]|nr:hypothetical protein [Bacteriovoracaceae bacterium]
MIKKFLAKKAIKNLTKFAAKREAQVILGTLATIAGHRALQKVSEKYPKLKFLREKKTA